MNAQKLYLSSRAAVGAADVSSGVLPSCGLFAHHLSAVGLVVVGLVGCGGEDNGRAEADSYKTVPGQLTGCPLAQSVTTTLMPGGDFESQLASKWQTNADGSTVAGGAISACPEDSSLPCTAGVPGTMDLTAAIGSTPSNYTYNDKAPAPPAPCDTGKRGWHFRAEGLYVWGCQLTHDFSNDQPLHHVDASMYDGVSFWARSANTSAGRSIFVAFDDKYTKEKAYAIVDDAGKPILDASGVQKYYCIDSSVDAEKCDRFGVGIGLDTAWRFYKIPFSAVRQRGFGVSSDRLHTEEILGFSFYIDVGDWDFWVDQIAFYKEGP